MKLKLNFNFNDEIKFIETLWVQSVINAKFIVPNIKFFE